MVMVSKPKNNVWVPKRPIIIGPKIKILNFDLEEKLDHDSDVEFRIDSNGHGLEAKKTNM